LAEIASGIKKMSLLRIETSAEVRTKLLPAIMELRKRCRWQSPGYHEILAKMGLNASTVRSWFHRGQNAEELIEFLEEAKEETQSEDKEEEEEEEDSSQPDDAHVIGDVESTDEVFLRHADKIVLAVLRGAGNANSTIRQARSYAKERGVRPPTSSFLASAEKSRLSRPHKFRSCCRATLDDQSGSEYSRGDRQFKTNFAESSYLQPSFATKSSYYLGTPDASSIDNGITPETRFQPHHSFIQAPRSGPRNAPPGKKRQIRRLTKWDGEAQWTFAKGSDEWRFAATIRWLQLCGYFHRSLNIAPREIAVATILIAVDLNLNFRLKRLLIICPNLRRLGTTLFRNRCVFGIKFDSDKLPAKFDSHFSSRACPAKRVQHNSRTHRG
jgi:hypothetical protein